MINEERLVDLYRRRRTNENDPPRPYEQIQSLPSSRYPRNKPKNEKCIIFISASLTFIF